MIDAGATATTLLLISGETHWFWTVETGGDKLTSILARSTKQTHEQAEQLKFDPAKLPSPASEFEPLEQRMDEIRSRIGKMYSDAVSQNTRFDVKQTWCTGGCCLTHQWIRRILSRL